MDFDITSMKQRAKGLMGTVKPNPLMSGLVVVLFDIVMFIIAGIMSDNNDHNLALVIIYYMLFGVLHILFMISLKWFSLKITREEKTVFSDIFMGFKEKQGKVLVVAVAKGLCIYIGMGFCLVGALFPCYWFRFAENIVRDDDTMNPIKAMGKSVKLMKGHYGELIKLDLQFIGWWALYVFTFGFAGIYVLPYTSLVYAEFYDYIKGQYEAFNG